MIKIKLAKDIDIEVLALLGRVTWTESHGHYIDDKKHLYNYLNNNFSITKTSQDINNPNNLYYIIYVDDLPAGYAKLILNVVNDNISSKNNCRLERIFILNDFIPLKIGQTLLTYVEEKAKELKLVQIWLSVYIKNNRAIRFYEKNKFKEVGKLNFVVNDQDYENLVYSKNI